MAETTEPAPAPATLRECIVCGVRLLGGVAVGIVERSTAPARELYACRGCIEYKQLLTLAEQTEPVGDGRLQFRPKPDTARPSL